jgi:ABC-2 type transport system permease protein
MNRIRYMVEKEIRQLRRNPVLLRIMIAAPIMQLILLSYAANYEVKNLNIAVVDGDHTTYSQRLVGKFRYLDNFKMTGYLASDKQARQTLLAGNADLVLVIPPHFERDLEKEGSTSVQLLLNAIDGSKAGIANGYATAIIRDFNTDILAETRVVTPGVVQQMDVENQYWYNPKLEYKTFMVPGVLFELLILVGGLVSALNIVREKEIGTMEQLNVTPIRKHEFIIGKSIPFVIIGLVLFTIGLLLGRFLFQVPMVGSMLLMYVFAILFLILCVGLGLLISTLAENQQQALYSSPSSCWSSVHSAERFVCLDGKHAGMGAMAQCAEPAEIHHRGGPERHAEGQHVQGCQPPVLSCWPAWRSGCCCWRRGGTGRRCDKCRVLHRVNQEKRGVYQSYRTISLGNSPFSLIHAVYQLFKVDNQCRLLSVSGFYSFSLMNKAIGRYRWTICGLVFFATTINYLDRVVISLLKGDLEKDFNWTETDYANLVSVFPIGLRIWDVGCGAAGR